MLMQELMRRHAPSRELSAAVLANFGQVTQGPSGTQGTQIRVHPVVRGVEVGPASGQSQAAGGQS